MRKGISPIVAVVLLIAISVIAAVGLYFWVGGIATQQPTPDTPATITAYTVQCNSSSSGNFSTIMIANTSPPGSAAISLSSNADYTSKDAGSSISSSSEAHIFNCSDTSLAAGEQAACKLGCNGTSLGGPDNCDGANGTAFRQGSGTISIFGASIAGAQITC